MDFPSVNAYYDCYMGYEISAAMETASVVGPPPAVAEVPQPSVTEQIDAGIVWLEEQGVERNAAEVIIQGPKPECSGTLAQMIGLPGHAHMKDTVRLIVADGHDEGKTPTEAVNSWLKYVAQRDPKTNQIVRADLDEQKKT